MREIVLDTETTGLDPRRGDRIVEIGAVEIWNKLATGNVFHVLINPEREVPDDAYRIHGHSTAFLRDKPVFKHVADDFVRFISDDPLVIHNAEFDVGFLNAEFELAGFPRLQASRVIDTLGMARRKHPGAPSSLDALCDRYRVDRTRRNKHGALLDATLLVEIYCELSGGRQHTLTLPAAALQPVTAPPIIIGPAVARKPAERLLTRQEEELHADFLERAGSAAIWHKYLRSGHREQA